MKNYKFQDINLRYGAKPPKKTKKTTARKQRSAFLAALCVCISVGLAVFALLPGEVFSRKVTNEMYDSGGFSYSGTLRGGKFSGQGRIDFTDGGSYECSFDDGRFHGQGIFSSQDGWVYEGSFEHGKPVKGTFRADGKQVQTDTENNAYEMADAWRYLGALGMKGQRGQGSFYFKDGAVYSGEFADGLASGSGTYTGSNGNVIYTGAWKGGLYEGEGEYHAPNGSFTYKGSFRAGKFSGKGTVTKKDGTALSGTWSAGWRVTK